MSDSTPVFDLLTDPLFTAEADDGSHARLSLPALLARLLAGPEIATFPTLAVEQRGHWWRFLMRCAAKVLHEQERSIAEATAGLPAALEAEIRATLAGLTTAGAWQLYQPDAARAGFLQMPTPDAAPPGTGNNYSTRPISRLTSALGVKNHERKADTIRGLTPEQAVYALIEYQFSAIYGGVGNYESQLMGSRSGAGSGVPVMGARIGGSNQLSFRHDVQVLLDTWPATAQHLAGTVWALWAEPWDGKSQLGSQRLDPAFIPIGRMVRLGSPVADRFDTLWFRPTENGRVLDHTDGGALGDPLTPLVPDPKSDRLKVRGTLRDGYNYREIVRLLFGDDKYGGERSPSVHALNVLDDTRRSDLRVLFEGTAYEQGKTGGFHRREIMLPPRAMDFLQEPTAVRAAHAEMLQRVVDAKKALRGAARIVLSGDLKPRAGDEGKTAAPGAVLEARVDAEYLHHLFAAAQRREDGDSHWLQPWRDWLAEEALHAFEETRAALPVSTGRRWQREVEAESYLQRKLWELRGSPANETAPDAEIGVPDEILIEEEVQ